MADPAGLDSGWDVRRFDLMVAVDDRFVELHGEDWPDVVHAIVDGVNRTYARDLQIHVDLVAAYHVPATEMSTGGSGGELLERLRDTWAGSDRDLHRDAVYLLLGDAPAGRVGQAMCIGGATYRDAGFAYGVALVEPANELSAVILGTDRAAQVMAHELGHLLGGRHEYGNCGEAPPTTQRPQATCTLMFPEGSAAQSWISRLNRLVMRGYADHVGL